MLIPRWWLGNDASLLSCSDLSGDTVCCVVAVMHTGNIYRFVAILNKAATTKFSV